MRVFGQHREAGAQLGKLAAGLRDRRLQPRRLGADVGGVDAVARDRLLRLDRAMHRADRDPGRDRDAGEALRSSLALPSIVFIEAVLDEGGERVDRLFRVPAFGAQLDLRPGPAPSIISPMIERAETD